MALLHAESFDGVSTPAQLFSFKNAGDYTKKWVLGQTFFDWSNPPANLMSFAPYITDNGLKIAVGTSDFGGAGPADDDMAIARAVPLSSKLSMGLWFRKEINAESSSIFWDTPIWFSPRTINQGQNGGSGVGVAIKANTHQLELVRLVNGARTILATSAAGLINQVNTDYYIELVAGFGTSVQCRVRVNEVDWINGTFNTKGSGTETGFQTAGIFAFPRRPTGTGVLPPRNIHLDDIYICDGTGSVNNDLLGVVSVPCIRANAQGSNDDWVNSHGLPSSDNYTRVNEQNLDDGTYIQSPNVGERDTHEYTDIVAPGPRVAGVIINSRAASTGGGRSMKALAIDGVDEALSADLALDGFLRHKQAVFETHPDGVSEWTAASINSTEFGVETT